MDETKTNQLSLSRRLGLNVAPPYWYSRQIFCGDVCVPSMQNGD